jgi:hypothetical protein
MRAISLWQPWATAIAVGIKKIETRHWDAKFYGPIAIHAAKKYDENQRYFTGELFARNLLPSLALPFGKIVAVAQLQFVRPTHHVVDALTDLERELGNYETGRYAWHLSRITRLSEPIPFKGAQGFFTVPDTLFSQAELAAVGL